MRGSDDPGCTLLPSFEIHDPKLCAYDKATGTLVGDVFGWPTLPLW
jgi:hypothetical protein